MHETAKCFGSIRIQIFRVKFKIHNQLRFNTRVLTEIHTDFLLARILVSFHEYWSTWQAEYILLYAGSNNFHPLTGKRESKTVQRRTEKKILALIEASGGNDATWITAHPQHFSPALSFSRYTYTCTSIHIYLSVWTRRYSQESIVYNRTLGFL